MLTIKNIGIAILTLLAIMVGGSKAYIDYQIQQQLNDIGQSSDQLQLQYADANLSWNGALVINQLKLQTANTPDIEIAQFILHGAYHFYDVKNTLPASSHAELRGVKIHVPDITSEAPALLSSYKPYYLSWRELRQLGFPQFLTDVEIHIAQQANTVDVNIDMQGQRWGNISINANLHNMPSSPLNWTKQASQIQVEQLVFSYTEQQLFHKLTTFLARRLKQPETVFKPQLAYKLRQDIESLRTQLPVSSLDKLDSFIQNPQTLQLALQPAMPYPTYQTVLNTPPQQLIKRLGFEIK